MLKLSKSQEKRMHIDGFSFGMKGIKGDSCVDSTLTYNPGVGSYNLDKGFMPLQKHPQKIQYKDTKRFKSIPNLTPGPGSYNPQLSFSLLKDSYRKKNSSSMIEMSKSQRSIFDVKPNDNRLGPGQYYFSQMNDTFFNSTLNSSRIQNPKQKKYSKSIDYSMNLGYSHKIRGVEFSKYSKRKPELTDYKLLDSAPVGTYSVEASRSQDSFVFSKEKRNTFSVDGNASPGPAKYNLPTKFLSKQPSQIATTMSTSKRFFSDPKTDDSTPGPSYYLLDHVKNTKYKNSNTYSFGKQTKDPYRKNLNPSPGQYKTFVDAPKGGTKMGSSQRPVVGNGVPGIGTYQVAMSLLKNMKQNKKLKTQLDQTSGMNSMLSSNKEFYYKDRLLKQKKKLIEDSPNLGGRNIQRLLTDNIPLSQLKSMDTPSPAYYDNLLQVVHKSAKFTKGNRREEFLDVYNMKLLDERSPGPAMYKGELLKPNQGLALSKQPTPDLFQITKTPGVGKYNIDESSFARYAQQANQLSSFANKNIYNQKNMKLPTISKSLMINKGYIY